VRPRAGTVGFPRLLSGDVDALATQLVEEDGVLILPASQFGYRGNHFRLGLGRRDMETGLAKLEARLLTHL
jgi:aspartate/methionine/tyrosine aminotransferase